jgi:predicted ArsR family transcriptional regulator
MAMGTADRIGQTLARLSHFASRTPAGEVDTSRDNILRIVQAADGALSVEDISANAGLHVNTVRTHLEVLRAAGSVQRTRGPSSGRGRPRWLYTAGVTSDPYALLAADLGATLQDARDPALADEAAARWREADQVAHERADDPDEAVDVAARALGRLGFEVDVSPVGDAIYLGQCPYASLIAAHPVICDIHAKAVEQVLAGTGQPVELQSVDVFPRRGVCVAHLRRTDVVPQRVVEALPEPAAPQSAKKSKKSRRAR